MKKFGTSSSARPVLQNCTHSCHGTFQLAMQNITSIDPSCTGDICHNFALSRSLQTCRAHKHGITPGSITKEVEEEYDVEQGLGTKMRLILVAPRCKHFASCKHVCERLDRLATRVARD